MTAEMTNARKAAAAILTPRITFVLTRVFDYHKFTAPSGDRRKALDGWRTGMTRQEESPDGGPVECPVAVAIAAGRYVGYGAFSKKNVNSTVVLRNSGG